MPTAGLLERVYECERLQQAVAAAAGGAGSVVALEGDAGIGKTTLLSHATRCARDAGLRVLSARGGEVERAFAYGVVRQLFEATLASAPLSDREAWLAGAAELAAPVVTASPPRGAGATSGSILHGLYWLSANLSAEQPVMIAIDDAHWADDASIAFLSYLARRVEELAILIVYASRVGEGASDELPGIADPAVVSSVLSPAVLTAPATFDLVERLLPGACSEPFARACHVATRGNPFLLKELLRALQADGVTAQDASASRVEQIVPHTIARATLARLRRLGPAASELSFAVAILGKCAELRYAGRLAGLDAGDAARAADELTAAAILSEARPLEFIHPIVRTAVYSELAPEKRAAQHKRVAQLLARDCAGDVALAPHLLATRPGGDPWVVERLRGAAQEVLERGAPDAACTYLERAHREPASPPDRMALLLALGKAEVIVARPGAVEHLREVLNTTGDAATRVEAARELVWALSYADRMDEAMAVAAEALDSLPAGDGELALRIEGELAAVAQFTTAFAKEAVERLGRYEGRLRGETVGERLILAGLAFRAARRDDSQTATATAELARLALADHEFLLEDRPGSMLFFFAVWALVHADRLDEAERYFDDAISEARARGSAARFAVSSGSRCQVLIRQGRLAEAEAEALSALAAVPSHALARPMLLSSLLHAMVERSSPNAGEAFLAQHGIDGDLSETAMADILLFSRGHLRLAAGDAREALQDFELLRRRDDLAGVDILARPTRASQALAYLQLGEHDTARELASEELARARQWNSPSAIAFALRTAGIVTGGDSGTEMLRESAASVEGASARYEHAQSLTEYGSALRRAGHRVDARVQLREGLALADRCGALRLARRARDELIATGARPRRAALTGIDALTPSQRRVCRLAADGLSNREIAQALFVTLRTVEGHLTQAYMKLDITSRDQLTRDAFESRMS